MSMMKTLSGLLCCLFLLQACSNDDDLPVFGDVKPVEMERASFSIHPFTNTSRSLILSAPNGDLLSCQQINSDTVIVVPDEILNTEGGYHLSLSGYYVNDFSVNGQLSDGMGLITYTHLKIRELAFSIPEITPPPFTSTSPAIWASLGAEEEDIEYFSISSSIYNISNYLPSRQRVYMEEEEGDIMVLLKLKAEEEWRFGIFENQAAASSLVVKPEELDKIPAKNINTPADFEIYWGSLIGIVQCENPAEDYTLQSFYGAAPAALGSAELPNLFEQFQTNLILKDGDRTYQLNQLGEQATEYLPDPINFTPGDRNIHNFELSSLPGFTLFRGDWSSNRDNELAIHELSWQVWGAFPETFKGPALPDCLLSDHDWLAAEEERLDLVRLAQYENSTMTTYADYIRFTLDGDRDKTNCNSFNLDGQGREEIRTKEF